MWGLDNGDLFPEMHLDLVGGGNADLPRDLAGSFAAILAYRGSWCGFCNAQLAAFQGAMPQLTDAGVKVIAFSVDDEAHAKETVAKHGITFPIGFGVDLEATGALLRGYVNRERGVLEASNFLLNPEGRIECAAYSSRTIGRFVPDDVTTLVGRIRAR